MKVSDKYPLLCTPGPRDSPHRIDSGSGSGPLDYESRDLVPYPETLPFKYFFGQLSFYLKDKKKKKKKNNNKKKQQQKNKKTKNKTKTNEKHGSLVVSAHTCLRC